MIKTISILMITNDCMESMKLRRCMDSMEIDHEIVEANNGMDALITLGEMADQDKLPNIIFIDANTSKIDGFEILNILKSDAVLKNIPSVILTNCGTHVKLINELKIDFTGNIRKNIKYSDYLKEVHKLFENFQIFWMHKAC